MDKTIPEAASSIYEILEPFGAEERQRIIRGAQALLGDATPTMGEGAKDGATGDDLGDTVIPGAKAKLWIRTNELTREQMEQVYHFEGPDGVEIIASSLPGSARKEQTASAYMLIGALAFLRNDEPAFTHKRAVAYCKEMGCYDKNNHSANHKALGNKMTGSVQTGFVLTAPGLKEAARVIRSIAGSTG
ncbi:MAG: hypothetical protein V3U35_05580 [Candidatus Neomarinimicrobiota bacterium]